MDQLTPTSKQFDYSKLDKEMANYLLKKEDDMREIVGRTYTELGKELKEAQDKLAKHGYGCFEEWYSSIGFKRDLVYRWINRYELIVANRDKQELLEDLPVSLTYEAAKPSAHPEAVQAVLDGGIKSHKEYKELERRLREAERIANESSDRAEQLEEKNQLLEKQSKDVIPIEQLDEVVSFRLEQYYEQTEIEKQQIIAEKDRKIRELESRKPEVVTKEVVPQKFKDELEEAKHFVRKLSAERKELEAKHKELSDLEYREKKLQIEGRISIYEMQIKIKNFITDAAPTIFQQGAIAANPIMKKEIEESIVSLEEFCLTLRDVLNSKIQIVEVQP